MKIAISLGGGSRAWRLRSCGGFLAVLFLSAPFQLKATVGYFEEKVVCRNGDVVKGFAVLKKGLEVAEKASATLDIAGKIQGRINLNKTGTLRLASDVCLDSKTKIEQGGKIDACGNTICLRGDLNLDKNKK